MNSHLPTSASTAPHRAGWLILLVSLLVATTAAPSSASEAEEAGFSDSSDAGVHQTAVETLAGWGYFEGTECDTDMFCPNDPMKRWVMAVWLVRVLGHKPLNTDTSQFADVEADEWWSPYAERLAKLEVTAGCKTEPLRYCPDRSVTRAQMATFLVRAFDLEEAPPAGFVDTEESVHSANIDALAAAGITAGCKTDPLSYCPDKPVTRAQMATFLHRAIGTSDRAILAALYHATGGPKWSARTKWLSNTPIGQWFGVSTNRDGNVYLLDLRGNGLKGFLPPVLGNLAHLSDLRLGDNELTGPIPEELGKLEQLAGLDLSSNKLTGPIPEELGKLSLLTLYLGSNDLTGSIPAELGNITGLRHMSLRANNLSGPIPPELGNLIFLWDLSLGDNELSGPIPPELFALANLNSLGLSNNELSGPIPKGLADLKSLRSLSLGWNQFDGPIPAELQNLTQLEGLFLNDNQLSGSIPSQLGNLEFLRNLNLAENELTGQIPPELGNLTHLTSVYLGGNRLSGSVPAELADAPRLKALYLSPNRLSGCIPKELKNLAGNDFSDLGLPFCR